MIKTKSMKTKINFLNTVMLTVVLIAFSFLFYVLLYQFTLRDVDQRLDAKIQEITSLINIYFAPKAVTRMTIQKASANVIVVGGSLHYPQESSNQMTAKILEIMEHYELRNDYQILFDLSGKKITASENIPPALLNSLLDLTFKNAMGQFVKTIDYQEKPLRVMSRIVDLKDGNRYVMLIATSLQHMRQTLRIFLQICLISIPFVLMICTWLVKKITMRVLEPVLLTARTADNISQENLKKRVEVSDVADEIKPLVESFNRMLDRLDKSFDHISEFSAHVAHELKTPLAVIRGEAEIALRKERTVNEYRDALQSNLNESKRMIQIVESLLYLSRLEHNPEYLNFKVTDFSELLKDVYEKVKVLAVKKEIQVSYESNVTVKQIYADETALRRMFLNILENAIKFTPEKQTIAIKVESASKYEVRVQIQDTGCGIAEENIKKIFNKFYHHNELSDEPGNGLGLSIAESIVHAHRGKIDVSSILGKGTTFTVTLPLSLPS